MADEAVEQVGGGHGLGTTWSVSGGRRPEEVGSVARSPEAVTVTPGPEGHGRVGGGPWGVGAPRTGGDGGVRSGTGPTPPLPVEVGTGRCHESGGDTPGRRIRGYTQGPAPGVGPVVVPPPRARVAGAAHGPLLRVRVGGHDARRTRAGRRTVTEAGRCQAPLRHGTHPSTWPTAVVRESLGRAGGPRLPVTRRPGPGTRHAPTWGRQTERAPPGPSAPVPTTSRLTAARGGVGVHVHSGRVGVV